MKAAAVIAPTQLAYVSIPAGELRGFVDGVFPRLAHFPLADSLAAGQGHRYVAGHDLLLDVPGTFVRHGPSEGMRHTGHVLLTDFPTKDGIPIPGFSESGLGQFLEQAGIHRGWLQINLCDATVGILAIAEGSPDLLQAIHGTLEMSVATFFDTFVEGGIEVGIGMAMNNPLLLVGGIENVLAGIVATWNTFSIDVDPLVFLGSAATSALLGFGIARGLARSDLTAAALAAIRSGIVGALFATSPAFGFGALGGFIVHRLARALSEMHQSQQQAMLSMDEGAYNRLLDEMCAGNVHLHDFIERAAPQVTFLDRPPLLPEEARTMHTNTRTLACDMPCLESCYETILADTPRLFRTDPRGFTLHSA
ncbi:MAG: hypothetical protein FJ276_31515 [Planctomycetes bacterium]|nr:hypothetical protein [Planctomycetota bacterium]